MYLAYKYVKKRKREREQAKAAEEARPRATETQPQDGVLSDDTRALTASRPSSAQDHPAPISSTPAEPESKPKETPEERAEKKRRRAYRLKIILGLFAPFTLQALDTTIIASALKFIADDFSASPFSPFPTLLPPLPFSSNPHLPLLHHQPPASHPHHTTTNH